MGERLTAANERARDDALGRLAPLLPGLDVDALADTTDDRRLHVLQVPDALLDTLAGPDAVEAILTRHEHFWGHGGVSMSRADEEGHLDPPRGAYRPGVAPGLHVLDVGVLAGLLGRQWTAIINSADRYDPALADVCTDLTLATGSAVNTNIYLSYGEAEGFGAHWDSHDTLIVQVHGAKRWSVYEPLVLSAQRPWNDREISDRPVWTGVLEVGMALLVPRGWGHRVEGSDDLTIHYTIGINRLEVPALLRLLGDLVVDDRLDHPLPTSPFRGADDHPLLVAPDDLARALDEWLEPTLIRRAVATHRARLHRRRFPALRTSFRAVARGDWSGLGLRLAAPSGVGVVPPAPGPGDDLRLAFDDRLVTIAAPAIDAVVQLADRRACHPGDLAPVVVDGSDERFRLARELVTAGVADVVVLDEP
ncbi:MAG: cupin domain-containing protein [Acidimicrobiales bacterium]